MSVLFGKKRSSHKSKLVIEHKSKDKKQKTVLQTEALPHLLQTFEALGVSTWLSAKCNNLGIKDPTLVQANCIPAILQGRDIVACAPTGSGKTAAFALPILHQLGKDPYGPFALILTPSRELAYQINDQFLAFGSSMHLKSCVIVGGIDMLKQSLELEDRPHIITATPGRLRDHLMRATPPDLSKIKFLVLDEADHILEKSFASDLNVIVEACGGEKRQTLLFSATMPKDLDSLNTKMQLNNPMRYDATPTVSTVQDLDQKYIFIPSQMKSCYLVHVLKNGYVAEEEEQKIDMKKQALEDTLHSKRDEKALVIVFVATCRMCQLLSAMANELKMNTVALHSMMSQPRRLAALGKFKSGVSNILFCTDVASRGIDVPAVSLVVNFDVPREATDYIHRVGRTARAGKKGMALSLISQYDIEILQNIEQQIDKKLVEYPIEEKQVLGLLTSVSEATRDAKQKLIEYGFEEKAQRIRNRRRDPKYVK